MKLIIAILMLIVGTSAQNINWECNVVNKIVTGKDYTKTWDFTKNTYTHQIKDTIITINNQHIIYQTEYDRLLNAYNSISNTNEKLALSTKLIKHCSDMLDNQRKLSKAYEDQIDLENKITTAKLSWIQNTHIRELSYKDKMDKLIVTLHEHFKKYESHHK